MNSSIPKTLLTINGKSILERIIEKFANFVDEIIIVIRPEDKQFFTDRLKIINKNIFLVPQIHPNGTAEAVNLGLQRVTSEIAVVVWGDHIGAIFMPESVIALGTRLASKSFAVVPIVYRDNPYVYFKFSDSMKLQSFHETHKSEPRVDFGWSDCGIFFLNKIHITDALPKFLEETLNVLDNNFLNFFPWLAMNKKDVNTLQVSDQRVTLGVNSPVELSIATSFITASLVGE